jgi:ribosome-associated heat shock protein Hsp15
VSQTEPAPDGRIRLDKWLFHARFLRTRSLAAKLIAEGKCRVNGERAEKPARLVAPGDVLTLPQGARIRVVKILTIAERRGGAPEAQALYEDLAPDPAPAPERTGPRPTKKDRRAYDKARRPPLE